MKRNLSALQQKKFDLIVVGAGIYGSCAALDAAQRGLSVAIIERGDFCSATSANSFKIIHGGIRYMQHGDIKHVRQSAQARSFLLRTAPHLTRPFPVVVPTYGYGMKSKGIMRIAMALYDMITRDRNRDIKDPAQHVPPGYCLAREEVMQRYPDVDQDGLSGAAVFHDGQMYNPPRLVLAFVRAAVELGAEAANYVEATSFIRDEKRVTGVVARDALTGESLEVHAEMVLNAAGPYAEGLLESDKALLLKKNCHWSRDAYFVVNRPIIEGTAGLAMSATNKDPEALLSRGARHLFFAPWQGKTLVGVWHKVYAEHPDAFTVTDDELQGYIDEVNGAYPSARLTLNDVSFWNAGLVQFGENKPGAKDLKFAHSCRTIDHKKESGLDGLITLIGVRYTTGGVEAADTIDLVFKKMGRQAPPSSCHLKPLFGGDISDFNALIQQAINDAPQGVSRQAATALAHNHGSAYGRLIKLMALNEGLTKAVGESEILQAEVVYACREEMAQTVSDVVSRRTDLGTASYPGREAITVCAKLMAKELGWNSGRQGEEVEKTIATFAANIRERR